MSVRPIPPHVLWWAFRLFALLMWAQFTSRGLDYLTGNPNEGAGIFHVTDPTPPMVWGATCLAVSLILAVGMLKGCRRIVLVGAFLAAAVNLAFAGVVVDDVLRPPIDDWRFFTDYCVKACQWSIIAYVMYITDAVEKAREE